MVLVCLLAGGTGIALGQQGDRYTLHLTNNSAYDIYHIYLSSSEDPTWHRDLLGDDILTTADAIDVVNISPGQYDLRLVDEDGDACVKMKVQFFQNKTVNITNNWLLGCEFHNPGR